MNFDPVKASFYLIAGVIGLHGLVVLIGFTACVMWFEQVQFECDKSGRLTEMLAAASMAALAFVSGFMRKERKHDDPSK